MLVTQNKTLIDKATSKILEIETSQTFMSDKYDHVLKSSNTKYRVSSKFYLTIMLSFKVTTHSFMMTLQT